MDDRPSPEAWQRLGAALRNRRSQLDPRYRNRQTFATDKRVDYRVVFDIEQAKRSNFYPDTMTALETAYGLPAGAFNKALADPEFTEFRDRAGSATVDLSAGESPSGLTVHVTDEPEPRTPPGTPEGFSDEDTDLGLNERFIWRMKDVPWQRKWGAIQHLRGGTTPLLRGRQDRSQDQGEGKRRGA